MWEPMNDDEGNRWGGPNDEGNAWRNRYDEERFLRQSGEPMGEAMNDTMRLGSPDNEGGPTDDDTKMEPLMVMVVKMVNDYDDDKVDDDGVNDGRRDDDDDENDDAEDDDIIDEDEDDDDDDDGDVDDGHDVEYDHMSSSK